jgi:phosphate transport system substrate-binding protein
VLIYKHQDRPDAGQTVLRFFDWAFLHGDRMADSLDYVPLPDKLVELVETTWRGVKSADDKPLWPVSHE